MEFPLTVPVDTGDAGATPAAVPTPITPLSVKVPLTNTLKPFVFRTTPLFMVRLL